MMHCCRNYFNSTHEIVKILSKQYPNGQMQMECAHTPIQSPSFLIIWNRQLNWSTKHRPTISFPRSHWLLMKWCSQHAKCPPILLTDSEYLLYLSSFNSFFYSTLIHSHAFQNTEYFRFGWWWGARISPYLHQHRTLCRWKRIRNSFEIDPKSIYPNTIGRTN